MEEHYRFEALADGVHFGRARAEGTGLCNTGIVDLGGATLLFDTSLTLRSARELEASSERLTGRRPTFAANSHWHLDHTLGNQQLVPRTIYATRRTAELLLEQRLQLESELNPERLDRDIADLEGKARGARAPEVRSMFEVTLRLHRALREEALELRITPPTSVFESEVTLPGDRQARLITYGAGHTESDAVLYLPSDRIVFAGDLVLGEEHPNLVNSDPEHWLVELDELERLRPERVGTGHGRWGTVEVIEGTREYLTALLELAREPTADSVPAGFRSWGGSDQFENNLRYLRERTAPAGTGSAPVSGSA